MKNIIIFILFLLVVIMFIFRGCSKNMNKPIIEHYRDTIIRHDTVIKTITRHLTDIKPTFVYLQDDTTKSTYIYHVNDSLLTAKVTIKETDERPLMDFVYTLNNYELTKTIIIKDSVYSEKVINKNKMYVGGGLVVNPFMDAAYTGVGLSLKNGSHFDVDLGYNFTYKYPFISVGYKHKVSFKR